MNTCCKTCINLVFWKGKGTHGIDYEDKVVQIDICAHKYADSREIENIYQRPGWCPGYHWSGIFLSSKQDVKPPVLTLLQSLQLAGLKDTLL